MQNPLKIVELNIHPTGVFHLFIKKKGILLDGCIGWILKRKRAIFYVGSLVGFFRKINFMISNRFRGVRIVASSLYNKKYCYAQLNYPSGNKNKFVLFNVMVILTCSIRLSLTDKT